MSLKSEGVDLNSEVASTEENETLMPCNPGDPGEVGGFSVDGARVLGELNDLSNFNAFVQQGMKEEEMMESVNRDGSLEVGMEGNNGGSGSKEGYSVWEGGDSGQENAKSDSKMDVEIKGNENAEVEDKVDVDRNQEIGMRESLQNPNQGDGIGLIVDLNLRYQDETRNEGGAESTEGFIEVNLPFSVGFTVNMDTPINDGGFTLIKEGVTSGQSNEVDGKEDIPCILKPNIRGIENRMEKEGEFYVSDLVWGKVRSHPWWPGLIIEPSAASEQAIKYFKKDSYLIAYFGDQSFAWNEVSHIKPFRMHFWSMKNQSSAEAFCHAVDSALAEVSRRVEFGLTCQCLSEEVSSKVKSHVVANAGVHEGSTCIYGGDSLSMADSFIPAKLVRFLEALAESPHSDIDMLEFTIARAQLLACSRWKGYYELPVLEELSGILGNDPDLHDQVIKDDLGPEEDDQIVSKKGKSPLRSISQMRMHPSMSNKSKGRKKRRLLDLMSGSSLNFPNGENDYKGTSSSESLLATKKHRAVDSAYSESRKERLGISMQRTSNTNFLRNNIEIGEQFDGVAETIGEGIRPFRSGSRSSQRAVVNHGGISINTSSSGASTLTAEETRRGRATPRGYPPTSEIFTKLCAAAERPMEGYSSLTSVAGFFCDFRNSMCLEYDKRKRKAKSLRKQKVEKLSELETTEAFGFEGTEDSYWTDRIIQSNFDEQILFEPGTPDEKEDVVSGQEGLDGTNFNSDTQHEMNPVVIELDADENSNEYSPTTLILNFTDLESVPSITNLNNIFKRYGPLEESQTKILSKSKRAKVVFKRRPDAETAFSSTGKFSIFGPSLVSYRLNYTPIPPKVSSSSRTRRGRKKATSSVKDSAI